MTNYVLVDNATGCFVAIDQMSGGYPDLVNQIKDAKIWTNIPDAVRYAHIGSKDYSLFEVVMKTGKPIDIPSKETLESFDKFKRQGY